MAAIIQIVLVSLYGIIQEQIQFQTNLEKLELDAKNSRNNKVHPSYEVTCAMSADAILKMTIKLK